MHTTSRTGAKRKPRAKIGESLVFVDAGGQRGPASDLAERVQAFYERHPLRAIKGGQRGIVESLKSDRDRR
jgi:hypothetical protein